MNDKLNVNELLIKYYEEQFLIQYPGQDPYKKDEYTRSISHSSSDEESQLLGSTISSFSQFSAAYSIDSEEDLYPPFQLRKMQKTVSLQDMFQYA